MAITQEPETVTTALTVRQDEPNGSIAAFASHEKFRAAQRIATALAASTIVPKAYQNSVANCLVAMELASRTGASVLMVMQNLHIIQGRPSWSAAFLVASVNSSGRFSALRYETKGGDDPKGNAFQCRAYARDLATNDVLVGEWITWEMVKGEGWLNKDGSKWKTMPGQMFRYRAASFWARVYAPEISLGMQTSEEAADITPAGAASSGVSALNQALNGAPAKPAEDIVDMDTGEVLSSAPVAAQAASGTAPAATMEGRECENCGGVDGKHKPLCEYAASDRLL